MMIFLLCRKARLTGFDPVVSGSGANSSNGYSKGTVYPYSTVTEDMQTAMKSSLIEHVPKKLSSSKSDNLLSQMSHGSYKLINERTKETISKSNSELEVKATSNSASSNSKWSKFLPSS